ncbi:hypothetical protein CRUP_029405 [Coryphaenoides rupestris]|nr:hypothetical protein CRUP_029405 [Coryphaenoides rupestris]
MKNSTAFFVLTPYGHIGLLRHLYFSLIFLWYVFILLANSSLVLVICTDRRLHEPMYLLLCSLFVNEIYGSSTVYPCLLSQMLSEDHEVSRAYCLLQVYCLYSSAAVEFCSLAAMAYDRYVSICYPLHYSAIMSGRRVCHITALIWACSLVNFTVCFSFTVRLDFCGTSIDKVFCDHYLVIQLACSPSTLANAFDLLFAFVAILVPLAMILFSYVKILYICLKATKETKQKALSTCMPQIISLANLLIGCIYHFADTRLNVTANHLNPRLRVLLSVYLLLCQPLLSPLMYGLNLSKIRQACKRLLGSFYVPHNLPSCCF